MASASHGDRQRLESQRQIELPKLSLGFRLLGKVQATVLGDQQLQMFVLLDQRLDLLTQPVDFAGSLVGSGVG